MFDANKWPGRAVQKKMVKELGLAQFGLHGDERLDPQPGLPDSHQFDSVETPITLRFWKPGLAKSRARLMHWSPLWNIECLRCKQHGSRRVVGYFDAHVCMFMSYSSHIHVFDVCLSRSNEMININIYPHPNIPNPDPNIPTPDPNIPNPGLWYYLSSRRRPIFLYHVHVCLQTRPNSPGVFLS